MVCYDSRIDLDNAVSARENYTRPLCRIEVLKYACTPSHSSLEKTKILISAVEPAKPTVKQAFLTKNYDKNRKTDNTYATAWGIFRSPTDLPVPPAAGLVGPLGESPFLPAGAELLKELLLEPVEPQRQRI